jgi:FMN phosphatase YigB (HAD superfamily)
MRNTAIEKALNRKMRPQYLGPMIIVSRNKSGAYIICDLDGTLTHAPVAAFRVVPYLARQSIDIPDLEEHIDVSVSRLRELEYSTTADPDEEDIEPDTTNNNNSDNDEDDDGEAET